MTPSELKYRVEQTGESPHYFTRETMKFWGDTMRNYGVRQSSVNGAPAWELYRKRPVKYGSQKSAYFDAVTFKKVTPK